MQSNHSVSRKSSRAIPVLRNMPTAEDVEDRALETSLVLLLSSLEFVRVQMEAALAQQRPAQVVEAARTLVNQVTGFADKHVAPWVGAEELTPALARAGDFFSMTQQALDHFKPAPLKSLVRWFTGASDLAASRERLQQVALSLDDVLDRYFSLFASRFQGAEAPQRWAETQGVFRADLKRLFERTE